MSGNSNQSINSPVSTSNDLTTLVGDDAIIATNLLQEFNDRQARHISVLSSESEVQYVPHSPTPSIQELSSPPPLRVRITAAGVAHYPPVSPGSAANLLHRENDIARWIRLLGNGEAVARAGERADEPEYVVSLYLPSDYSTRPTTLLPPWFLELLQASGGAYHTLAEAACGLKHPAAFAEVERYRRHHTHRAELEVARQAITADIDKEDDALQGIEHRMEAYGLHERLATLEGRMDIRQELPGCNNFVTRRPNSRRHRWGGPGGPL